MDTRTTLVITAFAVVVVGAATMVVRPVYAPGGSCGSCGALFAPGQLKISQPAFSFAPGIRAQLAGESASQFAPGQEAKNPDLSSPAP